MADQLHLQRALPDDGTRPRGGRPLLRDVPDHAQSRPPRSLGHRPRRRREVVADRRADHPPRRAARRSGPRRRVRRAPAGGPRPRARHLAAVAARHPAELPRSGAASCQLVGRCGVPLRPPPRPERLAGRHRDDHEAGAARPSGGAARPRKRRDVRADGPARRAREAAGGDPVRRPGGIRRSLPAPLVAVLLRADPLPDRPDRRLGDGAWRNHRQARRRRWLGPVRRRDR